MQTLLLASVGLTQALPLVLTPVIPHRGVYYESEETVILAATTIAHHALRDSPHLGLSNHSNHLDDLNSPIKVSLYSQATHLSSDEA